MSKRPPEQRILRPDAPWYVLLSAAGAFVGIAVGLYTVFKPPEQQARFPPPATPTTSPVPSPTAEKLRDTPNPTRTLTPTPTRTPTPESPREEEPPAAPEKLLRVGEQPLSQRIVRGEVFKLYTFRVGDSLAPVHIVVESDPGFDPEVSVLNDQKNTLVTFVGRDGRLEKDFPPVFPGPYYLMVKDREDRLMRFLISLR